MSITFTQLLDDIEKALAFSIPYATYMPELIWDRDDKLIPWAKSVMLAFPLLRPKQYGVTTPAYNGHRITLPSDFREIMSVEYPVGEEPPSYLARNNYLNPNFFESEEYFDVDRDYESGVGYVLYLSKNLVLSTHLHINYLTSHETDIDDNWTDEITIPDQYEEVIISGVIVMAFREFMTYVSFEPTVLETTILHLTQMVTYADNKYNKMISDLINQSNSGESSITPNRTVDKYDRIY